MISFTREKQTNTNQTFHAAGLDKNAFSKVLSRATWPQMRQTREHVNKSSNESPLKICRDDDKKNKHKIQENKLHSKVAPRALRTIPDHQVGRVDYLYGKFRMSNVVNLQYI